MKTIAISIYFIFLTLVVGAFLAPQSTFAQEAQEAVDVEAKEIAYTLPHAGILPDNPLYPFKRMRDSFWVFFTRDNVEKAEVLLLIYDKKIVMAQALAEKGKWELALETVNQSEKDFEKLLSAVETATKIGSSPTGDFMNKAKLSTDKHLEILESLLKTSPQGTRGQIEESMKLNVEHHNTLDTLTQ